MIKMECKNCKKLKQELKDLKNKVVNIKGWKGKDQLEFMDVISDWIVTEHSKSKTTGKVSTSKHYIYKGNVENMLSIIKRNLDVGETAKRGFFFSEIIKYYDLKISRNSFNGGKNRKKHYFCKFYYPIKILEHLGFIKYSGSGQVTLLKNK